MPADAAQMKIIIAAAASFTISSAATFNVLDFGAKGDGVTYDTQAIRSAFAACSNANGGVVTFPLGYTFLTGSFNVSGNTVLDVQGTILGSPNATDYVLQDPVPWFGPDPTSNPADPRDWGAFVQAYYVDNVTITGGGTVDGNGWNWWPCASNITQWPCSGHIRPHGVRFVGTNGVHIYNVSIKNSPMWQVHLGYVTGAHIHDVSITAPSSSDKDHPAHNTDGIDPDCAQDVLIERVYISTGDDCIAVKSGINWFGRTYGRPSANITVRDSYFGNGHGLSIGSEMSGGVSNVTFANIVANGTGTGIRIKSERGRGGSVRNILYANITLIDIQGEAVQITLNYASNLPPTNATGTPVLDGVLIRNVTAINPKQGWFLDGLPESPLQGLTLQDVTIINAGKLVQQCDYVGSGSCTGVLPSCPPCMPS